MKRRNTLKTLAAGMVGTLAIGYWAKDLDSVRDFLSNSFFKPTEQDCLMAICDTIIPKGEHAYGALDVGVPLFLLAYLERCLEPDDQENVKFQLAGLDIKANELHGSDFADCDQLQREEFLNTLSVSDEEDDKEFYALMKDQIVHGFRSSKEVMTNHYFYKVVPGEFNGCVEVNGSNLI